MQWTQAFAPAPRVFTCLLLWLLGSSNPAAEPLSTEDWAADLDQLVTHIEDNHRDPWHLVSREDFHSAVADLRNRLPSLKPAAIPAEFARLAALIGDGHTRLTIPVNPANLGFEQGHTPDPEPAPGAPRYHTLPVRFGDFEEGVHVIASTKEHRDLIGARVNTVGGQAIEEVVTSLAPFIAHDTDAGRRFHATVLLAVPELLAEAGVPRTGEPVLELTLPNGATKRVTLPPLPYEETPAWITPGAKPGDRDDRYFVLEAGPEAVIARIYQINDSPTETLGAFSSRLADAIARHNPARVILDLRQCHGGDQTLSRALVLPLIRWQKSARLGHVFALIGPETFSAAVNLAARIEEWTQATFAGEPTGSAPTHYSNSDREILDHSRLVVRVSTGYFVGWTGTEWRKGVDIGLPAKPRIDDYLAGRDTVLDAVMAFNPAASITDQVIESYETSGINGALILWNRYRTDPATAGAAGADVGNDFARYLMEAGELRYAAAIFLFNREFHPESIDAYLGEAEARYRLGDTEQAMKVLDTASGKSPEDARIRTLRSTITAGTLQQHDQETR